MTEKQCYMNEFTCKIYLRPFANYILNAVGYMSDHLSGKELFIRFTVRIFRESLSVRVYTVKKCP